MAEGAPLLREYGVNSSIEGSNPSVSSSGKFGKVRIGPNKRPNKQQSPALRGFVVDEAQVLLARFCQC